MYGIISERVYPLIYYYNLFLSDLQCVDFLVSIIIID